jgi:hypothetical protein
MDYIEKLGKLFNQLDDNIAYLCLTKAGWIYRQKDKVIMLPEIYYDLTESNFIKYSTISKNKEILSKLSEYREQNQLISFIKTETGFKVEVYNKFGDLIYRQFINFYDKVGFLLRWRLRSKYPELILNN